MDIAVKHGVIPSDKTCSVDDVVDRLLAHECWLCARRYPVFIPAPTKRDDGSFAPAVYSIAPSHILRSTTSTRFPPKPLSNAEKVDIFRSWYNAVDLPSIYEVPCAVCATLVSCQSVSTVKFDSIDLTPLTQKKALLKRHWLTDCGWVTFPTC
ncbi:uncharacterized protein LAESUDRAFT_241023 [Laetiporus sulphureus 93-53]|uniref:Uncharacterized protein n=1 Tax=Laetiporus sulphureus 93-53 TaxID=1314785 RepID=A0A165DKF2_9APHY|nr:uncharacterized protein LAESUDRAFT_241023 [Laetiporus sulphureus 93-53]KZT05076.1 hypothetical protein LAESUDRAFT_241023 [Laetiporus sulphureus 93-53]